MITPVNNHLLIEPLKHESFMASDKGTYEEIGVVVSYADDVVGVGTGDKVYFDGWLAAKFPKEGDGFYWLVKWDDVRAMEPKYAAT